MSDLFDIMEQRRSIRQFSTNVPPVELLQDLVSYATLAPSAMNRQDWHFTIILSAPLRDQIRGAVVQAWDDLCRSESGVSDALKSYQGNFTAFASAPALIAVDIRRPPGFLVQMLGQQRAQTVLGNMLSAGMAIQNLLLAAHAKGLGACVYTGPIAAGDRISKLLHITAKRELAGILAVGYPMTVPPSPGRKPAPTVMKVVMD